MSRNSLIILVFLIAILFIPEGCIVYKKARSSYPEEILSANHVRMKAIVLHNSDSIIIDRNIALIEVNRKFVVLRGYNGDSLMIPSNDIKSISTQYQSKAGTALTFGISVAAGIVGAVATVYGLGYIFYLLAGGSEGW